MKKKKLLKAIKNALAPAGAAVIEPKGGAPAIRNFSFGAQQLRVTVPKNSAATEGGAGALPPEPAEIMFYEEVGSDPWGGRGMSASDFAKVLKEVPKDRDIHLRVNSVGGDVFDGFAIKNLLDEWPNKVIATVDGVAASTASWMILGADEVRAHKASQMFMHDAMGYCFGNAQEMTTASESLDKTSDQIAGLYANKTGKGVRTMRQYMKDETLLTGEEAKEMGLVDKIVEGAAARNFAPAELTAMKNRLASIRNQAGISKEGRKEGNQEKNLAGAANNNPMIGSINLMNKKKLLELLNKQGITQINGQTITIESSDEIFEAALNELAKKTAGAAAAGGAAAGTGQAASAQNAGAAGGAAQPGDQGAQIIKLQEQINRLTEADNAAKKVRIENAIDAAIKDDKIPAGQREKAVKRAMADESYLEEINSLPSRPPGADPVSGSNVECASESLADVQNHILNNGPRFRKNFLGVNAGNSVDERVCKEIASRSVIVANTVKKYRDKLIGAWNANSIDTDLKRILLLQEMLEEFAVILMPLQNFSTVFSNIPLEGTDKVGVPFYPLQTTAAKTFDATAGYTMTVGTTTNIREVLVGGDGDTGSSGANAAANTAKDRKYIDMTFDSYTLRRQPFFNAAKLAVQNANKLAVDIFTDIISRVITAANYGASIKAVAAAAFTGDDVADLYGSATAANWPARGRALVLDHTYNVSLVKDPTFKQFLAYGATDPLRKAKIQEAYQFEDIGIVPNLTTYSPAGENLVGWINHMSAVLVATAPIMPTPEVRALLTQYDVVTHPTIGATFEYRRWGSADGDATRSVVECSYGANKGVASAMKRLTSQ